MSVKEALGAVRLAVSEFKEADFEDLEGFIKAKVKIADAVQLAKERGATADALVEASNPGSIAADDLAAAGAAARKARKLRQWEKEYANRGRAEQERRAKEREEEARAARVAERLVLRRGGAAAEKLEQMRLAKEEEERKKAEEERAARLAEAVAARRGKTKVAQTTRLEAGGVDPDGVRLRSRSPPASRAADRSGAAPVAPDAPQSKVSTKDGQSMPGRTQSGRGAASRAQGVPGDSAAQKTVAVSEIPDDDDEGVEIVTCPVPKAPGRRAAAKMPVGAAVEIL